MNTKKLLLSVLMASLGGTGLFAQDFTDGNLVLLRIPHDQTTSGGTTTTNGNKVLPMFLDEWDPTCISCGIKKTVELPTTSDGTNYAVTNNGSSSATPYISRSADGRYIVVQGFDAPVGTTVTSTTAYSTVNPSFALVDYQGNKNSTTKITNDISNSSWMKTTISYDGSGIWLGNGSSSTQGDAVHYIPFGGTTSTRIGGRYGRSLAFDDKKLIMGYGTTLHRIGTTDLPTTAQTAAAVTISGTAPTSVYGFVVLKDKEGNKAIYLCDNGTSATTSGIKKYLLTGDAITYKGMINLNNAISIVGRVNYKGDGSFDKTELYVIATTTNNTEYGKLIKIEDTTDFNTDMSATATSSVIKDFQSDGYFVRSLAWAPVQNSLLPIKLESFKASQTTDGIKITWTTASEHNNAYFEVLRSLDGQTFEAVGTVKGNGTTSAKQTYSFTDVNVSIGLYYYQLKQVDFDGKSETNSPIPAKFSLQKENFTAMLTVNNQVEVKLDAQQAQKTTVVINDLLGRVLLKKEVNLNAGINNLSFDLSKHKSPFIIKVYLDGKAIAKKLIN